MLKTVPIKKLGQLVYVSFCLLSMLAILSCKAEAVGKSNFNAGWKFKLVEQANNDEKEMQSETYDDSKWESVSLPHTAHIEPMIVNDQWQGICWYRKSFRIPVDLTNKKIYLEFEAAMNKAVVWLNGEQIAVNQGGYLPIVIDITSYVKSGKDNVVAVRLDNSDNPITGPKPLKILDFNMYGGLYRNAWLIIKNDVHISLPLLANKVAGGGVFVTFPEVSKTHSTIEVKTHLLNEGKVSQSVKLLQSLFFKEKKISQIESAVTDIESGKDLVMVQQISVDNAALWSPRFPNLYRLETSVVVNGKVVDLEDNQIGIREFTFKDNQLFINGEKTFLRGVNRHQEYPFVGYALSDNAQYRDAWKIKQGGFDYVRLSHYPQSPAFLDACDELGLVVIDAILGWQYYADNDEFRDFCYRSAKELIYRDRNHACVLAWEVSLNETKMPVFFMEKLNQIVHEQFPGKNVYSCGWMNEVYAIYLQARQHRLKHYDSIQAKPYSVSEYGDWEYYSTDAGLNQDKMPKNERIEKSSRQLRSFGEKRLLQQAANVEEAHNDNLNTPAFSDSYWVMFDYNRGYHDDLESSGLMDINRLPKFAYYFYKSQRDPDEEIVLNIASYWTPQSATDVKVFSNCEEVAFYLNDQLISKQFPDKNNNSNNLKHPPFTFKVGTYKPGTIKAVGYINGKMVVEQFVKTPGKAVGLKVWLDESGRKPQSACNDVLFVYVAAIDANGTVVPDFNQEVTVQIKGDAKVLNPEMIVAEAGIATALIRIGKTGNKVEVDAKTQYLKPGKLNFSVK